MQDRDRRGTVARGLALEFLRQGRKQGAWLNLRPFAVEVGALSSGAGDERSLQRALDQVPATAGEELPESRQVRVSWRFSASGSSDASRRSVGLWDLLKRLAIQAWDWTRRQYDARFRRRR